jgi:hypothetical protein
MAELVDAPASGAGDRKVVEVRVLFWAPFFPSWGNRQNRREYCFLSGFVAPAANVRSDFSRLAIDKPPHPRMPAGFPRNNDGLPMADVRPSKAIFSAISRGVVPLRTRTCGPIITNDVLYQLS